jgi:hypothetical protein
MDIVNQTTKELCRLKYHAYSYFSREEPRRVQTVAFKFSDASLVIAIYINRSLVLCITQENSLKSS